MRILSRPELKQISGGKGSVRVMDCTPVHCECPGMCFGTHTWTACYGTWEEEVDDYYNQPCSEYGDDSLTNCYCDIPSDC